MHPALMAVAHLVSARLLKLRIVVLLVAAALLFAPAGRAEDLHYFKNYFVTGDYAVDGVGLYAKGVNGWATGTITPADVPQGADIVAAYLYWETVETTPKPSSMNGSFDFDSNNKPNPIVGDVVGSPNTSPCWSQGGTGGPGTWLRVYRADVLRYLKVDPNGTVRDVDYTHTVTLPDSGINQPGIVPHTEGASLVVVYRILDGKTPYKAVVLYDGAYTMPKGSAAFTETIGGFYQSAGSGARMTQIVGNGQPGFAARLTVNGAVPTGVSADPFVGAQGSRWDNLTFNINLPVNQSSLVTAVAGETNQVCLSWGAVLMSTNVVNSDGDGILDTWKLNGLHLNVGSPATSSTPSVPATFDGCAQHPKDPCENLAAMGALSGPTLKPPAVHKDVFVQIDWMQGYDGHIHSPKLAALQAIAGTFLAHQIYVHFDVGNRYQGFATAASNYMMVPSAVAQGGHLIQESSLECPNNVIADARDCEYNTQSLGYSVLGWKTGIGAIENGFPTLNIAQNFAHDRKDIFHYMLLAHALAGPTDAHTGLPVTPPPSVSGVGDLFGGDVMVTLGLWRTDNPVPCVQDDATGRTLDVNLCTDQTGTSLVQAGTLFHELGHNLGLHHGGGVDTPNCMVDYPSTMNYLYQTRGLTGPAGDGSGVAMGIEHIDFSSGTLAGLNENSLFGIPNIGNLPYRLRYYGPATGAEIAAGSNAKANCNGTFPAVGTSVRLETPGVLASATIIDWSNGTGMGIVSPGVFREDIDFDGTIGDSVAGGAGFIDHNDWAALNLQQIGGRPNVSGLSVDVGPADISTTDLLGQSVLGQNVLGQNVLGQNVLGQSVLGQNVLGQSVLGQNVLGQNVLGQNVLGQNVLGQNVLGEVDYETAISTLDATGAATPLVATLAASSGTAYNQVTLTWGPPSLGQIRTYTIYRANLDAGTAPVVAGSVNGTTFNFPDPFTDTVAMDFGASPNCSRSGPTACFNTNYQYFITASDVNGTTSTPSNLVTAIVLHIFVTPVSGSIVYGNTIPDLTSNNPAIVTTVGAAVGALSPSSFSCMYAGPSNPARNVGAYTTSCSGNATAGPSGMYGVTYEPMGTLTITQRPLYIDAATNTKLYDSMTTASATPTVEGFVTNTSGLVYGDTVTGLGDAYLSQNVLGSNLSTLAVTSYTVNDGNGGSNYTVTKKTAAGTITARPLSIDAVSASKLYDSTTAAGATPIVEVTVPGVSGLVGSDSVTGMVETYLSPNVMGASGSTLVVATYTVNDGNGGKNYAVTSKIAMGTITQRPLAIDAQPNTKTFDGTTSSATSPTVEATTSTTGLVGTDSVTPATLAETYASPNVSNSDTLTVSPGYVVNDNNSGGNYTVTLQPAVGVITPATLIVTATGTSPNFSVGSYTGFQNSDTSSLVTGTLFCTALAADDGEPQPNTPISCSGLAAPNYSIVYSYSYSTENYESTGDAPLTIAVSTTETYGGSPVFSLTYSGFVGQDSPANITGTLICPTNGAGAALGTPLMFTSAPICSGLTATSSNLNPTYDLLYVAGTLGNVTPSPLTIIVTGTSPNFTANPNSYVGLVNNDPSSVVTGTLSCTVDATADAAGNKPISCSGLTAPSYYTITYSYAPVSVSASPAPLTVAVSGTITGNTPTFRVTYSGFINGDLPPDVAGTLSCNYSVGPSVLSGDTITSCTGLTAPTEYTVTYWLGKLKIVP